MYETIEKMGDIPLHNEHDNAAYLRDVGMRLPKDANYIQTNVVRVNGRRQVYIPVFRQLGASTLQVVDTLKGALENMKARMTRGGIDLQVVLDQSVLTSGGRSRALMEEGVPGRGALFAGHPDLPGRVADDRDRGDDDPGRGPGRRRRPAGERPDDQCDDARRVGPGDRSADRQRRDHLPGEHPPAPGSGGLARGGGLPGGERGRPPRADLDPLHVPGPGPAGLHARPRGVPLPADGDGGRLRDDRGVHPIEDFRPSRAARRLAPRGTRFRIRGCIRAGWLGDSHAGEATINGAIAAYSPRARSRPGPTAGSSSVSASAFWLQP